MVQNNLNYSICLKSTLGWLHSPQCPSFMYSIWNRHVILFQRFLCFFFKDLFYQFWFPPISIDPLLKLFLALHCPAVSGLSAIPSLTVITVQIWLHYSVLVSGMHVNCDNEGHLEEQLESLSEFTVLPVGKSLPGVNLTRISKNTICSPPTTSHLFQACHWEIQS